jgi:hypothetical protein
VRIGGLSSVIQRPMMKVSIIAIETDAKMPAALLREQKDMTEAARTDTVAPAPNQMNSFHPIMTLDL